MTEDHSTANVAEVFSSIQGEGLHVGRRQVFVRFYGCNLECRYCDTPRARAPGGACRIQIDPGTGEFVASDNPLNADKLLNAVTDLTTRGRQHSISLTGGEPLLHADFLRRWLLMLRGGPYVHLETNGTLPDELEKIIGLIDVTAMDIKLPSAAEGEALYDRHLRFLQIAARGEVFVKVVFADRTPDAELSEVVRIVRRVDPAIPVVLQPMTGAGAPGPRRILSAQAYVAKELPNVLVIPQVHKIIGCA